MPDTLSLVTLSGCDSRDRFEFWRQSGGTLQNNRNIGCGINSLTFLGVFSREDGAKLVDALASNPGLGTSFRDMMQYTANHAVRSHTEFSEIAGYVNTETSLRGFVSWIYSNLDLDQCTIAKFNRDIAGTKTGHSFIFSKDSEGHLLVVDPQTMYIGSVYDSSGAIQQLSKLIANQKFVTVSVMVESAPSPSPSSSSSSGKRQTATKPRRWVRVPVDPLITKINALSRTMANTHLSSPGSGLGQDQRSGPVQATPEVTSAPIVLKSFQHLDQLNDHGITVLKQMPDIEHMVKRKYLVYSVPVSVRITDEQINNWVRVDCPTDTGCTEHSAAFLEFLSRDEYARLINIQIQTRTGQQFTFTKKLLEANNYANEVYLETLPIRKDESRSPPGANVADVNDLFRNIPPGHATIAMISRSDPGDMGHSVVLAVDTSGTPVLFDPSIDTFARQISFVCAYLEKYTLIGGEANVPMYPPSIDTRGTKRDRSPAPAPDPDPGNKHQTPTTKKRRTGIDNAPVSRKSVSPQSLKSVSLTLSVTPKSSVPAYTFAPGTTKKSRRPRRTTYTERRRQTRRLAPSSSSSSAMEISGD